MRISHLIQTIQPDTQILTSVHGGDSFSKNNNNNNKKTPEQSVSHFNFPLTGAAMVQPARSDKWKMPWEQLKVNLD